MLPKSGPANPRPVVPKLLNLVSLPLFTPLGEFNLPYPEFGEFTLGEYLATPGELCGLRPNKSFGDGKSSVKGVLPDRGKKLDVFRCDNWGVVAPAEKSVGSGDAKSTSNMLHKADLFLFSSL